MSWLSESENGIVLTLRLVPRASKNEVCGVMDNALKVRLQAPPVEGKANRALVKFLAKTLKAPAGSISIISGMTGRTKRVAVTGINRTRALRALGQ